MGHFADIPTGDSTFKKATFTRITSGFPLRIRMLEEKARKVHKHYLPKDKISIECLGRECPLCIQNSKLMDENPGKKYNEIRGLIPRQTRFMVNVLNKTLVKTDAFGNVYYAGLDGQFPAQSSSGENLLALKAKPLNAVEILERGVKLFEQLDAYDAAVAMPDGSRATIANFDIILLASGKDKTMSVTAYPDMASIGTPVADGVEVDKLELYDLLTATIRLSADEITKLLGGISISDIFGARSGQVEDSTDTLDSEVEGLNEAVNESIADLFEE